MGSAADRHQRQRPRVVERHGQTKDEGEDALQRRGELLAQAVLDGERGFEHRRADGALVALVEPADRSGEDRGEVLLAAAPRLRRGDARRERGLERDRDELLDAPRRT